MFSARLSSVLILSFALFGVACRPHIGDDCRTSVDCSQTGDRLCDVTQPGGYCTIFNCEPGTCPDDAACIAFGAQLSLNSACHKQSGSSRFERTYCVLTCESNDDCRSGYECADLGKPDNDRNAVLIDRGRSGKVCVPSYSSAPFDDSAAHESCDPPAPTASVVAGTGGAAAGTGGTTSGNGGSPASTGGQAIGGAAGSDSGGSGG